MPELPDLEVFSANLTKQLSGKTLQKVNVSKNARLNVTPAVLKKTLEKQRLKEVYREGKELRFLFSDKNILGIHLMLKGKLNWFNGENPPKHTLLELIFDKDTNLALTDYQYHAMVTLNPKENVIPDALSKEVDAKFWEEQLQSKATIKNLLLDQHIVRGIGNAYADEILWAAGISPFSVAKKIPSNKIKSLANAVKKVLHDAEKKIRKAGPDIIGGEIRDFLLIHNADKKKSPSGVTIQKKMVAGRPTYYTREQELYK